MTWNWEKQSWPNFRYDLETLAVMEGRFLRQSGELIGTLKHLLKEDKQILTVDLISDEALKTAAIEGEYLNRDSLCRHPFADNSDYRLIAAGFRLLNRDSPR